MNPKLKLSGLSKSCFHVGSVRSLKVSRVQDIVSLPDCCGKTLPLQEKPVAISAAAFETYYFSPDQLYLVENPSPGNSGTSYLYEMVGNHPSVGKNERMEISRMRDGHYIAIATLWSGSILLLGSLEMPLVFEGSLSSGRTRAAGNSSAWQFTGKSTSPACQLDTDIVLVASPCDLQSQDDFILSEWNIDYDNDAELLSIPMALNPAGTIGSVTSWPEGQVLDPNGSQVDLLSWNAVDSRYEPNNGPNFLAAGLYTFVVTLNTLLKTGETCTYTFSQVFTVQGINQVPQIIAASISGTEQVGQTLTLNYTYYDPEADPEDVAASNRILLRRYDTEAAAAADTTGTAGTLVATDVLTYVLVTADKGKALRAFFTPKATSGPSPGDTVASNVTGLIVTDEIGIEFSNDNPALLGFSITSNTDERIIIDWGDGNSEFSTVTGVVSSETHSYASAATKTVRVYVTGSNIDTFISSKQDLVGHLDLSACTNITLIQADKNDLTSITTASTAIQSYNVASNAIVTAHDVSSWASLAYFKINNNQIPSLIFGSHASLAQVIFQSNPIANTPDLSACPSITAVFAYLTDIPGLVLNTTPNYHSAFRSLHCYSNTSFNTVINLSGCSALELFLFHDNPSALAINYGSISTIETLRIYSSSQSGTFPLSQFPDIEEAEIQGNSFTDVSVATHNSLIEFNASSNDIDTPELDTIINAFWAFRAGSASSSKDFMISGNVGTATLSNQSLDQLDGTDLTATGTYLNDGLVDNGWAVTY